MAGGFREYTCNVPCTIKQPLPRSKTKTSALYMLTAQLRPAARAAQNSQSKETDLDNLLKIYLSTRDLQTWDIDYPL